MAGFYLVVVSGATTGAVEGVEWEARAHHTWFHLQLALVRPAAELPHVFVTGFAGAVIWLAAWRRGRAMTWAGTAAFAIAVGLHSLHDGFITLFGVSPQPAPSSIAQTAGQAIGKGLAGGLFALGIGIASFLLGRHGARELSPPGAVAAAPPPWRPQIKTWGAIDPVRVEAPVPVGVWNPYGTNGYAAYGAYPGYAPPVGNGGYAPSNGYAGPGTTADTVATAAHRLRDPSSTVDPAAHRRPVPTGRSAGTRRPGSGARRLGASAVGALSGVPSVAGAGWYPYGDGSGRTAWWNGTTWSAPLRWDGITWRPE